jgi:hypothetical protein
MLEGFKLIQACVAMSNKATILELHQGSLSICKLQDCCLDPGSYSAWHIDPVEYARYQRRAAAALMSATIMHWHMLCLDQGRHKQ